MDKFIILPICDDLNRGDQALVWETKKRMENAGYVGEYYMLGDSKKCRQSQDSGIEVLEPILKHPSRKFKNKDNSVYGVTLLVKWGAIAAIDFIFSRIVYYFASGKLIKMFLSKSVKKTLNIMKSCDVCFVKGGGFIHSYGKITDIYAIYYNLYHIRLLQKLGKKVYVMPNSFGPFITKGVKKQVIKAMSLCEKVFVRESQSLKALQEIGINAAFFPDLGFGLETIHSEPLILKKAAECANGRKMIGITVRPYRFDGYAKYVEEMVKFIGLIINDGYFPVLIEQVLSDCDNESDMKCILQISSKLNKNDFFIISDKMLDCKSLKLIYGKMYAVVGTRFHSVIFAMSQGIPCVAIAYGGNKASGIMEDIGLEKYCINIENVRARLLYKKFVEMINEKNEYLSVLDNYLKKCKKEMSELENIMQQCLSDKKKGKK